MNSIKRILGILWIILALLAIGLIWSRAIHELSLPGADPSKKIFWYSILPVFTPLMFGLVLFGYYAIKGEYDQLKEV